MSALEGQTLGSYRIETLLGTGGMGEVYRAVHVRLNRAAAIKVMHAYLAADPTFQARFLREAQSAAALSHRHIVEVFDFGEEDGRSYLVMELVPDGSLRTLMRQRSASSGWTLALGLDLVSQAAEGLAYAHQRGMVHRDIKPDNLLLQRLVAAGTDGPSEDYDLKITDFGLARLAESGGDLTVTGMVVGTPAYMSPEQCQGEHLDARSDLYSLGVVLYEVATGSLPFRVKTLSEAIFKHVSAPPPPPRQLRPDLPEALEDVILRCLAKQPEDRFASATELTRALRGALTDSEMVTLIAPPGSEPPLRFSTPRVAADTPIVKAPSAPGAVPAPPVAQPASVPPVAQPASVPPLSEPPKPELNSDPSKPETVSPSPQPQVAAEVKAAPVAMPLDPIPAAAVKTSPVDKTPSPVAAAAGQTQPSLDISGVWSSVVARSGVLVSGVTSGVTASVTSTVANLRPPLAAATKRTADWAKRRPMWHWGVAGAVVAAAIVVVVVVLAGNVHARTSTPTQGHPTAIVAAKATATPGTTPMPGATATPVETIKAQYPLTAGTSGWPSFSNCRFANGGYTISGDWTCYAPGGQLGDATFSVRARQLSGAADQFYGILLRSSRDSRAYVFGINSSGQWTFSLGGSGNRTTLVAPTSNSHINTGLNTSNILTVRARGSRFTFYVNGVEVGTVDNSTLGQGQFGLINLHGNIGVVYNDFTVTVPAS